MAEENVLVKKLSSKDHDLSVDYDKAEYVVDYLLKIKQEDIETAKGEVNTALSRLQSVNGVSKYLDVSGAASSLNETFNSISTSVVSIATDLNNKVEFVREYDSGGYNDVSLLSKVLAPSESVTLSEDRPGVLYTGYGDGKGNTIAHIDPETGELVYVDGYKTALNEFMPGVHYTEIGDGEGNVILRYDDETGQYDYVGFENLEASPGILYTEIGDGNGNVIAKLDPETGKYVLTNSVNGSHGDNIYKNEYGTLVKVDPETGFEYSINNHAYSLGEDVAVPGVHYTEIGDGNGNVLLRYDENSGQYDYVGFDDLEVRPGIQYTEIGDGNGNVIAKLDPGTGKYDLVNNGVVVHSESGSGGLAIEPYHPSGNGSGSLNDDVAVPGVHYTEIGDGNGNVLLRYDENSGQYDYVANEGLEVTPGVLYTGIGDGKGNTIAELDPKTGKYNLVNNGVTVSNGSSSSSGSTPRPSAIEPYNPGKDVVQGTVEGALGVTNLSKVGSKVAEAVSSGATAVDDTEKAVYHPESGTWTYKGMPALLSADPNKSSNVGNEVVQGTVDGALGTTNLSKVGSKVALAASSGSGSSPRPSAIEPYNPGNDIVQGTVEGALGVTNLSKVESKVAETVSSGSTGEKAVYHPESGTWTYKGMPALLSVDPNKSSNVGNEVVQGTVNGALGVTNLSKVGSKVAEAAVSNSGNGSSPRPSAIEPYNPGKEVVQGTVNGALGVTNLSKVGSKVAETVTSGATAVDDTERAIYHPESGTWTYKGMPALLSVDSDSGSTSSGSKVGTISQDTYYPTNNNSTTNTGTANNGSKSGTYEPQVIYYPNSNNGKSDFVSNYGRQVTYDTNTNSYQYDGVTAIYSKDRNDSSYKNTLVYNIDTDTYTFNGLPVIFSKGY